MKTVLAVALASVLAFAPAGADDPAAAHRAISTTVPSAQAAFDRGLLMLYAFNVGQARDDFARAARLDPGCAMAYWGEAVSEIIDINRPVDGAGIARGRVALASARNAPEATQDERGLIDATSQRFAFHRSENDREEAYAAAMRAFVRAHSSDPDALVLTAFSVWDLPSDVTDPKDADIGTDLDAALALDPNQIGALHLRIHFEEALGTPERALANAERLSAMTFPLGASHLDHMPGHIYDRVGEYEPMLAANERALANDRAYFAAGSAGRPDVSAAGVGYMRTYHDHDVAYVLYGDTSIGRDGAAIELASHETVRDAARVALRLHRWRAVVDSATDEASVRSIAYARLGDVQRANAALGPSATPVERQLTAGAEALARGDTASAVTAYAAAYAAEDKSFLGDPKTDWYAPVGEAYAAALLRVKRYEDARNVFASELKRYPNDPRLVFGLATAENALDASPRGDAVPVVSGWRGTRPLSSDDLG